MTLSANLFGSELRTKLLTLLLFSNKPNYHLRELARLTNSSVSHISKEVYNLKSLGIIDIKKDSHLLNISVNNNSITNSIKSILIELNVNFEEIKNIVDRLECKFAIIFGSVAKNQYNVDSDIDLLIIANNIKLDTLYDLIREQEELTKREVQVITISEEDFLERYNQNDYFIINIINNDKIFLRGTESEFKQFIKRKQT